MADRHLITKLLLSLCLAGCAATPQTPPTRSNPPADTGSAHYCLAQAMYFEARGEGKLGMQAVGAVVLNRVADGRFPNTVCGVIRQGGERPPCQFSWWCDGKSDRPRPGAAWSSARRAASHMLASSWRDPTFGALFFHSTAVAAPWHQTRQRTARIGAHIFYR